MSKIIAMENQVREILDYYISLLEKFYGNVEKMSSDELIFLRNFSYFTGIQTEKREELYNFIEEMRHINGNNNNNNA